MKILRLIAVLTLGCTLILNAAATKPFPAHWGNPPKVQTRDLRELPGGYGTGSSTLSKWIQQNLDKDRLENRVPAENPPALSPPGTTPPVKKAPTGKPQPVNPPTDPTQSPPPPAVKKPTPTTPAERDRPVRGQPGVEQPKPPGVTPPPADPKPAPTSPAERERPVRKKPEVEQPKQPEPPKQPETAPPNGTYTPKEKKALEDYVNKHQKKENARSKGKGKAKGQTQRTLPPGLAKKIERGGELPPGWQKKIAVGETMPEQVLEQAQPVPKEIKLPAPPKGTTNVVVEGKVVRVLEKSRQILDVLDMNK